MARSTKIFGCGNAIMGDDGFGPAVVERLNSQGSLPESVEAVDAGTGVREYLFDYLLTEEGRPETIIVLDAVDFAGKEPGEVFCIRPADIPAKKIHDFPSINSPLSTYCLNLNSIPVSAWSFSRPRLNISRRRLPRD